MNKLIALAGTLVFSSLMFAGQPAQIGKLLSKIYPSLSSNDEVVVLVYFHDKGSDKRPSPLYASSLLSKRSLARRERVKGKGRVVDEADLPLDQSYVQEVADKVVRVRHQLKWFNAVSAVATKQQIETLRHMRFVREIELVSRWKKKTNDENEQPLKESHLESSPAGTTSLDYGTSFTQVNQIKVPPVHDKGIYGQGVVIGVFDNGFRLLSHESFASMNIIAQYDFVDHKESVIPNNPAPGFGSHGVNTLSTIGGYKPGQLIGPAFKADFVLARTENDSSETPIEEDNWAAAIQWADSIGVDVTSTSLGYLTYDPPYTSWTWEDMDGNTTLITRAADRAVSLGIVVVNSAGNEGYNAAHNTLIAPADGDSVIAAGAVTSAGTRSSFSSVGPTTDVPARIKPDIMAMGSGVKVASATNPNSYGLANGTSFSCPLSAGVAALIRCANPNLTPMQVRDAMRQTATNAASPDILMGWGILNADSAIKSVGIVPMGRISGSVFEDVDGNGLRDAGDSGMEGVTVYLSETSTETTLTDALGNFSFDSLAIGAYTVTEDLPSGWIRSSATASYSLMLLHMVDSSDHDFGNFRLGSVSGTVYHDRNFDGVVNAGDTGLANWIVRLTGPSQAETITDSLGRFSFTNLFAGTYTISESVQTGWIQSIPSGSGTYTMIITSGLDSVDLAFGNFISPDSGIDLAAGWNLLSIPHTVVDNRISTLFPTASSQAFEYSYRYTVIDTITRGSGFWLKFSTAQKVMVSGTMRTHDTIDVRTGWNIIGSISIPVWTGAITSIPGSVSISQFFGYDGAYFATDTIHPGKGYWVKVNQPGSLILSSSGAITSSNRIKIVVGSELPPPLPLGPDIVGTNLKLETPSHFVLHQNYPNPFNPFTIFDFRLPIVSHVVLKIYDVLGREVATLVDEMKEPGEYTVRWNASGVNSGVYFYKLVAGEFVDVKKMVLLR